MKKISKFFLYVIVFLTFFVIFLPRESLYNVLEKELEKNQVVISNELKKDELFSFNINNGDIYYQGINGAKIKNATFATYLFYTNVSLKNISVLENLSSFIPTSINLVEIEYSIFNFNKIKVKGDGNFGEFNGEYNIFTKIFKIELMASDKMKSSYSSILKNMKLENGRYYYEYKL